MNRKERELKDLLTIKTLEYYKKYSGQNNYVQAQALEDLKVIQKSFESISTSVLMENQKRFISFEQGNDRILSTIKRLEESNSIPQCMPRSKDNYGNTPDSYVEILCYFLFEILEGKHNDFMQKIIDKTNTK